MFFNSGSTIDLRRNIKMSAQIIVCANLENLELTSDYYGDYRIVIMGPVGVSVVYYLYKYVLFDT